VVAHLSSLATLRYVASSDSDNAGCMQGKYFHGIGYLAMHFLAPVLVDAVDNFSAAAANGHKPVVDCRFAAGSTFRLLHFFLHSEALSSELAGRVEKG